MAGQVTGSELRLLKLERAAAVNRFLFHVASVGRRFFRHGESVSGFEIDVRGRVWFRDSYSHRCIAMTKRSNWRGFTNGGTMRSLVERLTEYIRTGVPQETYLLGPWPDFYAGGDLWGYGDAMQSVRDAAIKEGCLVPRSHGEVGRV